MPKQQKGETKNRKTGQIILNTIIILISLAIIAIIIALFVLLFQNNQNDEEPTKSPSHPPIDFDKIKMCIQCIYDNRNNIMNECQSMNDKKTCFINSVQKFCSGKCEFKEFQQILSTLDDSKIKHLAMSSMTKTKDQFLSDTYDILHK
jgi:hypothetical protein